MRLESSKNTKKNFASGLIYRMAFMVFQFIIRTIIIQKLGAEYGGLDMLFASVLQVLNLTELGVGNALVFSMYKPIAEDNTQTLCALMKMYKVLYRIIGFIIFFTGIVIMPLIPRLISGGVPNEINVYIIYLINLLSTVLTYWLFSYMNSLLLAYQRNDVSNKIGLSVEVIKFITQLGILFFLKDYYLYLAVTLLTTVLNNVVIALITKRMYPSVSPTGDLPRENKRRIFTQIKDIFTAKMGGVITNSCDTIIVSSFLGLAELTKYSNYYYIVTLIRGFMSLIYQSTRAGIGNKLLLDDAGKNYRDFLSFSYICNLVIAVCTNAYLCGIQQFMSVWATEKWLYPDSVATLFAVYLYVHESASVLITYKDAAGIWHKDRFRPLAVSIANLLMNIIMVQYIGIYGIVLSTILSFLLIGIPWLIGNTFRFLFKRAYTEYVVLMFRNALLTIASCVLAMKICHWIPVTGISAFITNVLIAAVTTLILFGGMTFKCRDAISAFYMLKTMIRGK